MCSDSLGMAHLRWLAKRLRPSSRGNRLHLSAGPGESPCALFWSAARPLAPHRAVRAGGLASGSEPRKLLTAQ